MNILILPFILLLSLLLLSFSLYKLSRNQTVYDYRSRIIEIIFSKDDWKWRHKEFRKVSYNEMVYKFWKPLDSFYKDKKFLK